MDVVDEIFDAFGGSTSLARATEFPIQTVNDWRRKGKPEIPPWRRDDVLKAARRAKVPLPDHCVEYLKSRGRNVGSSAPVAAV